MKILLALLLPLAAVRAAAQSPEAAAAIASYEARVMSENGESPALSRLRRKATVTQMVLAQYEKDTHAHNRVAKNMFTEIFAYYLDKNDPSLEPARASAGRVRRRDVREHLMGRRAQGLSQGPEQGRLPRRP